uniref:Uncharacterized protein n=1 Tax=Vespula pensylvanica TaxID=30213 RepID=A0A834UCQ8_VESPE|nr:hypothetical protein H0235_004265 [Vespula pensylvanica]
MEVKNAKVNLLVVVRKAKKRTTQRSESSYYMSFRIPFFLGSRWWWVQRREQNTGTRAYMNLTHPVSRVSVVVLQARRAVSERSKCQRQKAKLFLSAARENDLRLGPVLAPLSL